MKVLELWRHPVKSMQGELLDEAGIEGSGLAGDRAWGVRDEATGKILTGRRDPQLLEASARLGVDGQPVVVLPDTTELHGLGDETDDALSSWIGRSVRLVAAEEEPARNAEAFADATDDASAVTEWTMPQGRFVDLFPLLLLTTSSLREGKRLHPDGQWVSRRFRPNVFIDTDGPGWVEDGWVGSKLAIGSAVVAAFYPCSRCTMVTRPQPGGIERDLDVFKTLASDHGANIGVWATVTTPGRLTVGDTVQLDSGRAS